MKCPVCNSEMENYTDYMDHIIMETEDKCIDGCKQYAEHFITGGYEVGVKYDGNWFTWQWDYAYPIDKVKIYNQEIEKAVTKAKQEVEDESKKGT